jgi:hypothetical protein
MCRNMMLRLACGFLCVQQGFLGAISFGRRDHKFTPKYYAQSATAFASPIPLQENVCIFSARQEARSQNNSKCCLEGALRYRIISRGLCSCSPPLNSRDFSCGEL